MSRGTRPIADDDQAYWPDKEESGGEFGGTVLPDEWERRSAKLPDESRFINPTDTPFSSQQQRIPGGDVDTAQETRIRKMP